jgi:hypothetical protein
MKILSSGALLLAVALLVPAWAQSSEPTIDQIYQAANAGRLAEADRMIDQVLGTHPNSAKAHYVKAELAARESNAAVARKELETAQRLAPGLPFAKADAVAALRAEVNGSPASAAMTPGVAAHEAAPVGAAAAPAPRIPVTLVALVALGIAGLLLWRRRPAQLAPTSSYAPAPPVSGPFEPAGPAAGAGASPAAPWAQPSMGSTIGRGLATGLAVGAGALAAEEIGRRMFGHQEQPLGHSGVLPESERGLLDPGVNADMGGQDFGIGDAGTWDDGGSQDAGAGDWDT